MEYAIPSDNYYIFCNVPNMVSLTLIYIAHKDAMTTFGIKFSTGMFFNIDEGLTTKSMEV